MNSFEFYSKLQQYKDKNTLSHASIPAWDNSLWRYIKREENLIIQPTDVEIIISKLSFTWSYTVSKR